MAVLNDDENLEQDQATGQPGQPAKTTQPGAGGGAGYIGAQSTGQAGPSTSAAGKAPTSSGSYTNLMSYIGANQGNDATMGKAASNYVDQVGGETDRAINNYGAAGRQDASNGTNGLTGFQNNAPDFQGQAYSGIVNLLGTGALNPQTPDSPTSPVGGNTRPQAAGQTQKTPRGTFAVGDPAKATTPASYTQMAAPMTKAPTEYGGLVGLTGAGGGRDAQTNIGSLLKQTYTQPSYSEGENSLDAFLTGSGAGGQAALQGIRDKWGGEGQKLESTEHGILSAQQKFADDKAAAAAKHKQDIADAIKFLGNSSGSGAGELKTAQKPGAALTKPLPKQVLDPSYGKVVTGDDPSELLDESMYGRRV
jgi:hypothetical protein